jgi:hypothetical protein
MSELTAPQKETLKRFRGSAAALLETVAGLTDDQLDCSLEPGEWTIRQIINHVATDGDVWSISFQKAIANSGAPVRFEGFLDNELWADNLAFDKRSIGNAVLLIEVHRRVIAELAEHFPDAWERYVVILDTEGKKVQHITAGQIIGMLTDHMEEHIATIEAIKQHHGV